MVEGMPPAVIISSVSSHLCFRGSNLTTELILFLHLKNADT